MRIRPLTGQVLVRILPRDTRSPGGIELPEVHLSPEAVQETHRNPSPPPPEMGIVEAIGKWPKTRSGMLLMPEFGVGARVVVGHHAGQQLARSMGEKLRLVNVREVLAVLSDSV